jgi:hypothetical protein
MAFTGKSLGAVISEFTLPARKNALANSKPPFHLSIGNPRLGGHSNCF